MGQASKRRNNVAKARKKQAKKKATEKLNKFIDSLPKIVEDDLLAFQYAHFGDDSKPDKWFVDPEAAINFEPEYEDELGYYEDGTKRTLTDDQIAMFRRTELWQTKQEQARAQEDAKEDCEIEDAEGGARSPVSDASSLEDELLAYASKKKPKSKKRANQPGSWKRRRSEQEVPYDQRNKRKWEGYVGEVDSVEGSITHRRMARELDQQQTESIELDY